MEPGFKTFIFFLFSFLVFGLVSTASQDKKAPYQSTGFKKYVKNYNHKDHVALRSRLGSILQDKRGILYVVPGGGRWNLTGFPGRRLQYPTIGHARWTSMIPGPFMLAG
jgi:hypothetical protein